MLQFTVSKKCWHIQLRPTERKAKKKKKKKKKKKSTTQKKQSNKKKQNKIKQTKVFNKTVVTISNPNVLSNLKVEKEMLKFLKIKFPYFTAKI